MVFTVYPFSSLIDIAEKFVKAFEPMDISAAVSVFSHHSPAPGIFLRLIFAILMDIK